jgi:hypothetical protein
VTVGGYHETQEVAATTLRKHLGLSPRAALEKPRGNKPEVTTTTSRLASVYYNKNKKKWMNTYYSAGSGTHDSAKSACGGDAEGLNRGLLPKAILVIDVALF